MSSEGSAERSRRLSPTLTLTLALNPFANLNLHLALSLWRTGPEMRRPWRTFEKHPPTRQDDSGGERKRARFHRSHANGRSVDSTGGSGTPCAAQLDTG